MLYICTACGAALYGRDGTVYDPLVGAWSRYCPVCGCAALAEEFDDEEEDENDGA